MHHGRRILPHRIKEWLRNRGLHWSCFCSLTFGGSRSTRIVEALSGSVYAFCNVQSSVCGFQSRLYFVMWHIVLTNFPVNLSRVHETASYESEYDHLPALSRSFVLCRLSLICSVATSAPDMARLRNQFRSIEGTQPGPYFRGYCGEHESEYQGAVQLAGTTPGKIIIKSYLHSLKFLLLQVSRR
jgi:hypothetical protein